jgi:ActD protein
MSELLLASFADAHALVRTARWAKSAKFTLVDAFSPFPVQGMAELLGATSTRLRVYMFFGGMAFAAASYALEYWTAVYDYPINSGERPLNAWPAFMLFPFAIGIFGAAFFGFVAFLVKTGLPRLHDPLFALPGFERATQDRFVLALQAPVDAAGRMSMIAWLREAGAEQVWELET